MMKSMPSDRGAAISVILTTRVWFPACRSEWKSWTMGNVSRVPLGIPRACDTPSIVYVAEMFPPEEMLARMPKTEIDVPKFRIVADDTLHTNIRLAHL